ncbi:MAG: hypothetical protein K2N49_04965, partial [Ruminococcus sp.]|nr:hypothetical protein [Ruminococcus sp.]
KTNQTPENIEDIPEIEDISDIESIPENRAGEISTTEISKTEIPETESTGMSGSTAKSSSSETKKSEIKTESTTTSAKSGNKSGNNEKNPEENNSEPESETPEPIEFREYYPEDFMEITVQLAKQDGNPPIEFSEIDYSWFDTGEKLSPCKSNQETIGLKIEECQQRYLEQNDERSQEQAESAKAQIYESLEIPRKGRIMDYTYGDGNLYFLINYDDLCGDYVPSHCMEIVKCNLESQTSEVVFSLDTPDNPLELESILFNGGDIFVTVYYPQENGLSKIILNKVNTEKNSLEKSAGIPDEIDYVRPMENNDGKLLITGMDYNDDKSMSYIYEYDPKTKKFFEIYSTSAESYYAEYGQGCVVVQENIDEDAVAVCDKFSLNTGIRGAKLEAVSDNRVSFIADTSDGKTLYTYDLQRMERYEININRFGTSAEAVGDNLVLSGSLGHTFTFLIPDIGAAFVMLSFENSAEIRNSGDSLYIVGNPYNDEKYNFVGDFVGNYEEEKKVYIFS